MKKKTRGLRAVCVTLAAAALLGGCKARKHYADLLPGSHSADYSHVLGRIQRVAQADPTARPVWVIRYANGGDDAYNGRLNLYPEGVMAGYLGGELVEVRGGLKPQYTLPGFPGMWYQVDEIRMWSNQAAR